MTGRPVRRRPTWSGILTRPAVRIIPAERHAEALWLIRAVHTVLFASIGAAIVMFVWDGLLERPRRRTACALAIALGESAVYVSNNQVCPLTPLAEELGAGSGSVVDIFLPDAVARRIPLVSSTALVAGLGLNARAFLRRRRIG